ncbi:hypothetical protein HYX13_00870 [Candidatus Woesearchaeota archaeon]|nr:hypothetical protein [Candidatus Woesearchaeota archaeon]
MPAGYQDGEFNLVDTHRNDGVEGSAGAVKGVFVSPFDYLMENVKSDLAVAYDSKVKPSLDAGQSLGTFNPWEPFFTNKMLLHSGFPGTLVGEWYLKEKAWAEDGVPDMLTLLPGQTNYPQQHLFAAEDAGGSAVLEGDWREVTDASCQTNEPNARCVIFENAANNGGDYFGIFTLDESETRAVLKLEYQTESYPAVFSSAVNMYIERDNVGRRDDGVALGVYQR